MNLRDLQDAFALVHHESKYGGTCRECGALTHGRKPYCIEHVERMPYVEALLAEVERRRARGALLEKPHPIDLALRPWRWRDAKTERNNGKSRRGPHAA